MSDSINRRDFLKITGAAGFGLGILGNTELENQSINPDRIEAIEGGNANGVNKGFVPSEPYNKKQEWTATELWTQSSSRNLHLVNDAIEIEDRILVENDAAGIGAIQSEAWETISSDVVLRKTLEIDRWPVREALITMLVYPVQPKEPYSGGKLQFRVNGHDPIVYEIRHFWTSVEVPARYLKRGKNVIEVTVQNRDTVFRTPLALYNLYEYGSSGPTPRPYSSERSTDGGNTWTSRGLGASNDKTGEYPIRLKLRTYHREGYLQTPILNLSNSNVNEVLRLPVEIESASYDLKADIPVEGQMSVYLRSGKAHRPESGGWSEWQQVGVDLPVDELNGRYIQLRFNFQSDAGDTTPSLKGLALRSRCRPLDTGSPQELFVAGAVNKPISRSSFDFRHETPTHPELQELREQYQLDDIVSGARTEFEKILRLRNWVSGQWEWYLPDTKNGAMTRWDAREILNPDNSRGKVGGNCLNYSIVFAQACQSFGIAARMVNMNYSVWGGHELPEVWSRDYEKWVLIDPQFDTMFVYRDSGLPLSVLEVHRVFLDAYYPDGEPLDRDTWTIEDRARRASNVDPEELPIRMQIGGHALSGRLDDYIWWKVTENPPAPGYQGGYGFTSPAFIRWLPRSNWMSQPNPMPVNHGRTHWGWDGYLAWTDSQTPETPEHRHYVRRKSDMYGNLFSVDYSAEPEGEGILRIDMATESPGFDHFEVIDNGQQRVTADPSYLWELSAGHNTLKLRSVDAIGNRGSESRLAVNYIPYSRTKKQPIG